MRSCKFRIAGLQRFGTAVGLKRPNLQDLRRLGLLSPTASSNSSPRDSSELSGFGMSGEKASLANVEAVGHQAQDDVVLQAAPLFYVLLCRTATYSSCR